MRFLVCPHCAQSNSEFNLSCSACGTSLPQESEASPESIGSGSGDTAADTGATPETDSLGIVSEGSGAASASSARQSGGDRWTGRILSRYEVLERIGRGGMGTVYRARQLDSGALVALKTVHGAHLSRLRREIHALARIQHPGIVRILDSGTVDGSLWYAMELIEGTTLRGFRLTRDRVSPEALRGLLSIVRRLCTALSYLHGEGLVHRDLKPDNVLVRGGGEPILVDFGIVAEFAGAGGREALDPETRAVGTLRYMAPEQLRGELLDARADLYALGCVLYELLSGQPPFQAHSPLEVIQGHLYATPRAPSELVPELPPQLDELVLRLLAKSPRQRLGYADDVAAVLAGLGAQNGSALTEPQPRTYLYRPGFVGRDAPLQLLRERLLTLHRGVGGMVLIAGQSGVGKTRLAMELARNVANGVLVLTGECLPGAPSSERRAGGSADAPRPQLAARGEPLHPLRRVLQAVADQCREYGRDETERLLGRRGKVLAVYEPALAGLPGQAEHPEPAELPAEASRLRLFNDLSETLAALGQRGTPAAGPVLLILDDLQWADELTLGFLELLLGSGRLDRMPLLVVGTFRSEELDARAHPRLQALTESPRAHILGLGRLDEAAVGVMVGDMLALAPAPEVFVRYLARHSEGNPFFVAEYLRTAVGARVLYRGKTGHWQVAEESERQATESMYARLPLPGSIRELVGRRLDGLTIGAHSLVQAAAVLGRELDGALLADVSGMLEGARLEAIQELLARQFLEEAETGRLRFLHDKIREAAYDRISGDGLQQLHREAAKAISTRFAARRDEHLAALGHHWEKAGEPVEARECYLAGARKARNSYAHGEAERLYRAYLRLASDPSPERIRVRGELSWTVLRIQGRTAEAIQEQQQALNEARQQHERAIEGQTLSWLGTIYSDIGRMEEALELHQQALAIHRELGDQCGEGEVLSNLGNHYSLQGRTEDARAVCEQALAIHRKVGNRRYEAMTLGHLAVACATLGRSEAARALYEQALAIHREVGNLQFEGITLSNLAVAAHDEGLSEEARAFYEQALSIHQRLGNRRFEGLTLGNLAKLYTEQGRLDEAQPLFEQSIAIHREVGNRHAEGNTLVDLARLKADRGRPQDAYTLYEQAMTIHRGLGKPGSEGGCHAYRARLERHSGQLADADRSLVQAERLLRQAGYRYELAVALCERGHLSLAEETSSDALLQEAQETATTLRAGPGSELGQALVRLGRAQAVFEAGEGHRLYCGECVEDLPEGVRHWMSDQGSRAPP